ncbi:MAG TPA: hypothetical protein VD907_06020 [Verrucomicrobiae bacterium]|nr:hypothetical protein [Verrucomicrobiae bacterium]
MTDHNVFYIEIERSPFASMKAELLKRHRKTLAALAHDDPWLAFDYLCEKVAAYSVTIYKRGKPLVTAGMDGYEAARGMAISVLQRRAPDVCRKPLTMAVRVERPRTLKEVLQGKKMVFDEVCTFTVPVQR